MADYLLIIGDREALGWVLTEQRMAFPDFKRAEIRALTAGDRLFVYTTRGCFGNPTRDRGRVIACGEVRSAVAELEEPVELGGRRFPAGCDLHIAEATAWSDGVELAPLVPELGLFEGAEEHWSIRLRRPLAKLTPHDAELLDRHLAGHRRYPLDQVLADYARWWQPSKAP
ncbi:hypothetical protein [Haloactinomyces albus]|uniref:EVE domain-containing protein n=1 Tax=Haloactinomyces albus TaxID=1352928 RepID=A0AAE3ZD17_9ACTN|nr:hypothetical protein [Haloactinomyces albus]MDR7300854.1 hypothetical protein [Haloactinomyces albus]